MERKGEGTFEDIFIYDGMGPEGTLRPLSYQEQAEVADRSAY